MDYIGYDPVVWVRRLLKVNEGSSFTEEQKSIIEWELIGLKGRLETETPRVGEFKADYTMPTQAEIHAPDQVLDDLMKSSRSLGRSE